MPLFGGLGKAFSKGWDSGDDKLGPLGGLLGGIGGVASMLGAGDQGGFGGQSFGFSAPGGGYAPWSKDGMKQDAGQSWSDRLGTLGQSMVAAQNFANGTWGAGMGAPGGPMRMGGYPQMGGFALPSGRLQAPASAASFLPKQSLKGAPQLGSPMSPTWPPKRKFGSF